MVFIGWFDFTRGLNDVRPELAAFAEAGLSVHCSRAEGLAHPNLHPFERFSDEAFTTGPLADFVRRFRASLVTYHFGAERGTALRFRTSTPSRFLFTLAAGVPVLLPRGRCRAMERLVADRGIGFAYASPAEAARRLRSADWREVQERAWQARGRARFDGPAFSRFVRGSLALSEEAA